MFVRNRRALLLLLLLAAVAFAPAAACGPDGGGDGPAGETGKLRLGVFPNVTHAPALVGLEQRHLEAALGPDVELTVLHFNAGGEAIEAMMTGALDITFIGPNPTINGFAQSEGREVRVIAGATSGGVSLVVRDGIDSPTDLAGTTLASPALGNTQDVALRTWLKEQGYDTDLSGSGDVSITPLANPDILQAFQTGDIDGAWVPEPWASRLRDEGGGTVLVDEADLWPDGRFVTTQVITSPELLEQEPGLVRRFLEGHLAALDAIADDPDAAQVAVLDAIEDISGTRLPAGVVAAAWENLTFTWDPIASSLVESAGHAVEVGLLDPVDLDGIYDLRILNELLAERGDAPVDAR